MTSRIYLIDLTRHILFQIGPSPTLTLTPALVISQEDRLRMRISLRSVNTGL